VLVVEIVVAARRVVGTRTGNGGLIRRTPDGLRGGCGGESGGRGEDGFVELGSGISSRGNEDWKRLPSRKDGRHVVADHQTGESIGQPRERHRAGEQSRRIPGSAAVVGGDETRVQSAGGCQAIGRRIGKVGEAKVRAVAGG